MKLTKRESTIALTLLLVIVIIQAGTVYFADSKIKILEVNVVNLENEIEDTSQEIQSKINELTEAIGDVSSEQADLDTQLSELKAVTSADFSGILENEIQGVVTIKTDSGQGTGFIITESGYVVTNSHVLAGASYARIHTYDNEIYYAELIGWNQIIDVAVLKISGNFHSLEFGDSDDSKIGEKVIAIGNPLGLSFSATEGIISAVDRVGINGYSFYFQTDAALNPGSSGGPLINTKGKVIGINNFKMSGADNLGFALESKHAIPTINEITLASINKTII